MSPEIPPTVHVFEPSHLGHRPFFLAWLLTNPPSARRWTLHTTGAVLDHPTLAPLVRSPSPAFATVVMRHCHIETSRANASRRLIQQVATAMAIRRSWRQHARAGDTAFIPYYDDLAIAFSLPWLTLDMPLCAIGMRDQFHQHTQGIASADRRRGHGIKGFLLHRLLGRKTTCCYFTNQLPLKRDVDSRWGQLTNKVRFYPDPAELSVPVGKSVARRQLGLPAEKRYVLCYGSLTARKGISHLLDALESPDWPQDTAAVFAGTCRDDIGALLHGPRAEALATRGRLHRFLGFVDSARENLLFQAADAVWLVYDKHDFMSGCLVQAGMHQRPVIGCTTGLIAWYITTFFGGLLHNPCPDQSGESLRAIATLLHDDDRLTRLGENLGRAFAQHTHENFRTAIHAGILGLVDPRGAATSHVHPLPSGGSEVISMKQSLPS